ncbi:MAG: hypothetical protein J0L52_09020 [Caulobacterales bacterium]|nr:hypothetical protein [Caulobacterales bacterium]
MTHDQIDTLRDDIRYMKSLADDGANGPLLGGSVLVAAGIIFGAASIVEWMMSAGTISDAGGIGHLYLWGAAGALFTLALIVLIRRQKSRAGVMSPSNRASGNAWMGVGLAIFSLSVAVTVLIYKTGSGLPALIFPSLIFALYGTGWAVSAAMSGQKWLWVPAFGGWVAAPLVALFAGTSEMWLVYGAGIVLLALVPGAVLMRREPVQQA